MAESIANAKQIDPAFSKTTDGKSRAEIKPRQGFDGDYRKLQDQSVKWVMMTPPSRTGDPNMDEMGIDVLASPLRIVSGYTETSKRRRREETYPSPSKSPAYE